MVTLIPPTNEFEISIGEKSWGNQRDHYGISACGRPVELAVLHQDPLAGGAGPARDGGAGSTRLLTAGYATPTSCLHTDCQPEFSHRYHI